MTYDDLSEMFNLDMTNLYFRGFREYVQDGKYKYVNTSRYICSGVLLMNLNLIRQNNAFLHFKNYYYFLTSKDINYNDQNIINTVFTNKIGFLPPKFGIYQMKSINIYKKLNPKIYRKSELEKANKKPIIRHIFGKLPNKSCFIHIMIQ